MFHATHAARPAAALAVLALLAPVALAAPGAPTVTLSDFQAAPGDLVVVRGAGFPPSAPVAVALGDVTLAVEPAGATVGVDGNVGPLSLTVPATPSGSYALRVSAGGASASATLDVWPSVTPARADARPGERVGLAAVGFRASVALTVNWDGKTLATDPTVVRADASGTAAFSFVVPDATLGTHTVRVVDGHGNQATAVVQTGPVLRVTAGVASPGGAFTVSGTGYHPDTTLQFLLVGGGAEARLATTPSVPHASASGSWSGVQARVPPVPSGAYVLRVTDAQGASAEAAVRVEPRLALAPPSASPGVDVVAEGHGFPAGTAVSLRVDGLAVGTRPEAVAAANGSFRVTFTVPTLPVGTYPVIGSPLGDPSATASASLSVTSPPRDPNARPPEATRHLASPERPDGTDEWYRTTPKVILFGGRDDTLRYRLDDGEWRVYSSPILIPEGRHTLRYYATSPSGVAEPPKSLEFRVDTAAPKVEGFLVAGEASARTLSVTASDALSGVASGTFVVTGPSGETRLRAALENGALRTEFLAPAPGSYSMRVTVLDAAGNAVERDGFAFDVTGGDDAPAERPPSTTPPPAGTPPAPEGGAGEEARTPAPGIVLAAVAVALGALVLTRRRA